MTRRLVVSYVLITVVVLAVLVLPLGVINQRRQLGEVQAGLERDAFVLATLVEDGLAPGALDSVGTERVLAYASEVGARVVVVDASGAAVLDTDAPDGGGRDFSTRPEVAAALEGQVAAGTRRSDTLDTDLVYAAVPVASSGLVRGAIRLTYPTAEVDDRVRRYWLSLGGVALVSLVVVAAVGVVIARSVARPVRRIEEAATAIGTGDLTRRAPEDRGPQEVRSLARSLNRTADRLQDLITSQEAFVADASHQLRTPLTALRLQLENVQAGADEATAEHIQDAVGETERLTRLVDGLLVLARADRASVAATAERRLVGPMLSERAEVWRALADERSVALVVDAPDGLTVTADPDRLVQVLDNLVANALDAAPEGTSITLQGVEGSPARSEIHVVDDGAGLPPEERARAFDRLWRADPTRDGLGGSGLGLAIVAKLVHADGGTARLDAAPGGGVDAVVDLPS